jgi:hypothetical protein
MNAKLEMIAMKAARSLVLVCLLTFAWTWLSGCASLQDGTLGGVIDDVAGSGALDEETVVAGLKEALRIGTERTVDQTARQDGYLGNPLIRIPIPDQLNSVTSTLRQFGGGGYVDELETGMNRAAELAAAEAVSVFWDAITSMTISDAFTVLQGDSTAATEYFRARTWRTLDQRYRPIVKLKMDEVGLSRIYGQVLDIYDTLPLTSKPELVDLEQYVTDQALTGLFTVLAQEEQRIRSDPIARTTDLLRRVFGG